MCKGKCDIPEASRERVVEPAIQPATRGAAIRPVWRHTSFRQVKHSANCACQASRNRGVGRARRHFGVRQGGRVFMCPCSGGKLCCVCALPLHTQGQGTGVAPFAPAVCVWPRPSGQLDWKRRQQERVPEDVLAGDGRRFVTSF